MHVVATARIPRRSDEYKATIFQECATNLQHVALSLGNVASLRTGAVLTRVHSECMTGDVFGSTRCDCGAQLHEAFDLISARGQGVLIYLRQEGRGIGLVGKLKAYNLQDDRGLDTIDANLQLGYKADQRNFGAAAQILAVLGVGAIELVTNNPRKVDDLKACGVNIVKIVHSSIAVTEHNIEYLRTKRDRLGHAIQGIDT